MNIKEIKREFSLASYDNIASLLLSLIFIVSSNIFHNVELVIWSVVLLFYPAISYFTMKESYPVKLKLDDENLYLPLIKPSDPEFLNWCKDWVTKKYNKFEKVPWSSVTKIENSKNKLHIHWKNNGEEVSGLSKSQKQMIAQIALKANKLIEIDSSILQNH